MSTSEAQENVDKKPRRKRKVTELTLQWLAEKVRRAQTIKEEFKSGSYKVDSKKLAESLINTDDKTSQEQQDD